MARPKFGTKPKKRKVSILTVCVPEASGLRQAYLPPVRTTVQFTYVTQLLKAGNKGLGKVDWNRFRKVKCATKFYKLIGVM